MADKKISELDLALLINDDAEFPFSQDNAGEPTTFKGRITQLGTKIAEDMTFSNLRTTSKKLVGAINELLSLGSPIIIGTTAPTSSIGADGNIYVQYTAGTGGADDEVDGIYVKIDGAWCEISTGGGSGTTDYVDLSNKPQVNSVELVGNKSLDDLGIMPASLSKTVSGSIAHFTDGADNIPVKSLVSEIVAVETGTGEKSPDNPYSISGFDSGVVSVCGKNLLDYNAWKSSTATIVRATTIFQNNGVSVTATAYDGYIFPSFRIPCVSGETYTLSWNSETNIEGLVYIFFDDNTYVYAQNDTQKRTFTVPQGTNGVKLRFGVTTSGQTINYSNIQVELDDTATNFEEYKGNTYTFTFGQTVFGGHFDNKGNLVVTHKVTTIDDLSFTYESGNTRFVTSISDLKPVGVRRTPFLTSVFYSVDDGRPIADVPDNSIYSSNTTTVYIKCLSYTDPVAFKTAFTGAKIVYPIEPITLAITSQDIPTLLGENNIYSNCGDVEVNYYTDNADEIVEVAKATASTPLHNYSTDEQIVGTWIDGSTLYEKTFDLTLVSLTNATWTNNVLGTSSSNIKIRKFNGIFNTSGGSYINAPFADYNYCRGTTEFFTAVINDAGNDLNLRPQIDGVTMTAGVCTIQYTKSST